MSDEMQNELRKVFADATHQYAEKVIIQGDDWNELRAIEARFQSKEETLQRLFEETYDARVEAMRSKLYDDASHFDLPAPSPPGEVKSTETIEQTAHRLVKDNHANDLAQLEQSVQNEIDNLLSRVEQHNRPHQAFNRAALAQTQSQN